MVFHGLFLIDRGREGCRSAENTGVGRFIRPSLTTMSRALGRLEARSPPRTSGRSGSLLARKSLGERGRGSRRSHETWRAPGDADRVAGLAAQSRAKTTGRHAPRIPVCPHHHGSDELWAV